ncbi:peptidase S10 [Candidatus Poribacteria bacterium]|nr:peptidase S10 [Candidatus Poribacteria bacterium]MYA58618.1 peptidase S10 [Candidatus Poribacteria bacterium]
MSQEQKKGSEETKDEGKHPDIPEDKLSVTHHSVTINGEEIRYTATAGTLVLKEEIDKEGEKPKASVFFIAYTRDDVEDTSKRPITFSFNGGPGSSSVWLHLGVLGPRCVKPDEDGELPHPPYQLTNNDCSILDKTDLVFIDPVSTGFSRAVPGEEAKQFHGFKRDIESVGDFILLYLGRYKRWGSPKLLIGESYGTTRAGGLAGYLQGRHGAYLNAILLVSVVLNFQTIRFAPGNDLPYILYLPTYAATARYHDKLDEVDSEFEAFMDEVKAFALGDYTLALMQGSAVPPDQRAAIVQHLAKYTGLTPEYIERTDMRINIMRFCKELLRDEGRTVGRFDSRYKGIDRDAAGETYEYDPSSAVVQGAYTAALNAYVRDELEFESDLPYEILSRRVHPWDYGDHQNEYVNVSDTLRAAMTMNPALKVFVANGYYDLATPFLASEYTFSHLGLDESLQDNITTAYYQAGHMMYIDQAELRKMKDDLDAFLDDVLP